MGGTVLPSSATSGHQALRGRSQPDCHPISSISGLREALDAIVAGGGAPLGSAAPQPVSVLGTTAPGTALAAAREDHTHAISLGTTTVPGIVKLGPGGAMPYPTSGTTIDSIEARITAEEETRAAADADLDARKVNIGTGIDATRLLVGENPSTAGGDADLTWVPSTVASEDGTGMVANFGTTNLVSTSAGVDPWMPGEVTIPFYQQLGDEYTYQLIVTDGSTRKVVILVYDDSLSHYELYVATYNIATPGELCAVVWTTAPSPAPVGNWTTPNVVDPTYIGTSTWEASVPVSGEVIEVGVEGILNVEGTVDANTVRVDGMTGTGERVVVAGTDGTQRDVDELAWTGTKLTISTRTVGVRYRHVQGSASATWTIIHNLDEYPSVTVVDSSGNVCLGDVKYDSTNQITVSFGAAFAGNAYLN